MARSLVLPLVLATLAAAPAAARTPTVGPKDAAGVACLADASRALAWLEDVRGLASRLGLPGRGLEWLAEETRKAAGADLLAAAGWRTAGLKAEGPVCVHLPGGRDQVVLAFGVDDEKRALATVQKLLAALGPDGEPAPKPVAAKVGKLKAWRFAREAGKRKDHEGPWLVLVEGTGYLARTKENLAFLGTAEQDHAAALALPAKGVAVAGIADIGAFGAAAKDDDLTTAAKNWVSRIRLEATFGDGRARLSVRAANGGLLALVGTGLRGATRPAEGRLAAVGRIDEAASGFVQLNLPVAAVLDALKTVGGGRAPSPALAGALGDLLGCLAGDLTIYTEDGLAGLAGVASATDPERCERGLAGLAAQANGAGIAVSEEGVDLGGLRAHRFRFGKPDAAIRFPLFVAMKDRTLLLAMTPERIVDAAGGPRGRYLDRMDAPAVRDALEKGHLLVSHGFGTDMAGNLVQYAALARHAVSEKILRFLDLFDLPVLASDLVYDSSLVLALSPDATTLDVDVRFLGGDPMSKDPREKAWGMALRKRYSGRMTAWRTDLAHLIEGGTADLWGRKARRALLSPDPITDALLVGGMAGVAASYLARRSAMEEMGGPVAAVPDEPAEAEQTPCQKYLMAACIGRDPDGAACKDARAYYEKGDGTPSPKDEEACAKKLEKLGD